MRHLRFRARGSHISPGQPRARTFRNLFVLSEGYFPAALLQRWRPVRSRLRTRSQGSTSAFLFTVWPHSPQPSMPAPPSRCSALGRLTVTLAAQKIAANPGNMVKPQTGSIPLYSVGTVTNGRLQIPQAPTRTSTVHATRKRMRSLLSQDASSDLASLSYRYHPLPARPPQACAVRAEGCPRSTPSSSREPETRLQEIPGSRVLLQRSPHVQTSARVHA